MVDWQASRNGRHFDVGTLPDASLFAVMGTAICIQTLSSVAVAVALWRTTSRRPGPGLGVRGGSGDHHRRGLHGRADDVPEREQLAEAK